MKIIFCVGFPINISTDLKGSGNWITGLIKAMKVYHPEIEITLCCLDPKVIKLTVEQQAGVQIFKLPTLKNNKFKKYLFSWSLYSPYNSVVDDFKHVAEKVQPDIIQIFGLESQFIRIVDKIKIPIVIHFQGFKPAIDFKYFPRIKKSELLLGKKLKDFIYGNIDFIHRRKSKITSYLNKVDYSNINYVLGRTEWDHLITQLISPKAQYFHCQEILRQEFYDFEWQAPKNKKPRILTVTGGGGTKSVDIIYEVVKLLERHQPSLDFEWHLVGLNKTDLIPSVMNRRGYRSNKIKFAGKKDANGIIELMKGSDIFVYPSALENSPNALMEAMLTGMPVLTTYAGGIPSLAGHLKTAFVVAEGEPYAMAGGLLKMLDDKSFSAFLGKNARKERLIENSPESVAKQTFDFYKKIKEETL